MTEQSATNETPYAHARDRKVLPRRQRRSSETRARIVSAAREVFAESGLGAPSIDDITERADVGKGTFYYYFDSKEDLIQAMMGEVIAGLVQALVEKCEGITDLTMLLDRAISVHIEFFSERWEDFVLYYQGRADLTLVESYPGLEASFIGYLQCIERLVAPALNHPVPKAVLRQMACAVGGFVSGYYSFAAIAAQDNDVDEAFRELRGAMARSLARFVGEASSPAQVGAKTKKTARPSHRR